MNGKGGNVYFLSDAHLGAGTDSRERELSLCRLLDTIAADAAQLVLIGDILDFWFTYRHVVPRGHIRLLGTLARLSDAGVEIHYYTGNHDMWMFDYLEGEIGAVMHSSPDIMRFDGHGFLVGHGDGLGHLDRSYDCLKSIFGNRVCQHLFALLPPSLTFPIARHWSDSNKRKHTRASESGPTKRQGEGIESYIKERMRSDDFDYAVFGHLHCPTSKKIENQHGVAAVQYVNTGDWLYHRTYAIYSDGELKLCDWRETNGLSPTATCQ